MIVCEYPDNKVIRKIEIIIGEFDPYNEVTKNKVKVYYTNGDQVEWDTTDVRCGYNDTLGIDSKGEFIYGTSLRGIFCVYAKTGELKWRSKRWASTVVVNPNDTISCLAIKKIFILSPSGKLIKEIKTHRECSVEYLNDQFFMIGFSAKEWTIVDAETLSNQYIIPAKVFLSRIRLAKKEGNLLHINYWLEEGIISQNNEHHVIDLEPYACK